MDRLDEHTVYSLFWDKYDPSQRTQELDEGFCETFLRPRGQIENIKHTGTEQRGLLSKCLGEYYGEDKPVSTGTISDSVK